jgi:hypothetical protein
VANELWLAMRFKFSLLFSVDRLRRPKPPKMLLNTLKAALLEGGLCTSSPLFEATKMAWSSSGIRLIVLLVFDIFGLRLGRFLG